MSTSLPPMTTVSMGKVPVQILHENKPDIPVITQAVEHAAKEYRGALAGAPGDVFVRMEKLPPEQNNVVAAGVVRNGQGDYLHVGVAPSADLLGYRQLLGNMARFINNRLC